jgi:hypothetical protein
MEVNVTVILCNAFSSFSVALKNLYCCHGFKPTNNVLKSRHSRRRLTRVSLPYRHRT